MPKRNYKLIISRELGDTLRDKAEEYGTTIAELIELAIDNYDGEKWSTINLDLVNEKPKPKNISHKMIGW